MIHDSVTEHDMVMTAHDTITPAFYTARVPAQQPICVKLSYCAAQTCKRCLTLFDDVTQYSEEAPNLHRNIFLK